MRLLEAQGASVGGPAELLDESRAEWLAVTNLGALRSKPDLQSELQAHHRLVARGQGWELWRILSRKGLGG